MFGWAAFRQRLVAATNATAPNSFGGFRIATLRSTRLPIARTSLLAGSQVYARVPAANVEYRNQISPQSGALGFSQRVNFPLDFGHNGVVIHRTHVRRLMTPSWLEVAKLTAFELLGRLRIAACPADFRATARLRISLRPISELGLNWTYLRETP